MEPSIKVNISDNSQMCQTKKRFSPYHNILHPEKFFPEGIENLSEDICKKIKTITGNNIYYPSSLLKCINHAGQIADRIWRAVK
jgi:hypothetical protein